LLADIVEGQQRTIAIPLNRLVSAVTQALLNISILGCILLIVGVQLLQGRPTMSLI